MLPAASLILHLPVRGLVLAGRPVSRLALKKGASSGPDLD
jgi:hypothetical protein